VNTYITKVQRVAMSDKRELSENNVSFDPDFSQTDI